MAPLVKKREQFGKEIGKSEVEVSSGSENELDSEGESDDNEKTTQNEKDNTTSDSNGDTGSCPICLEKFLNLDLASPQNCGHTFCLECILEWSKCINICPIDRTEFDYVYMKSSIAGNDRKKIKVKVVINEPEYFLQNDTTTCEVCHQSDKAAQLLLCDACDLAYHWDCLESPLFYAPINEWFCPPCSRVLKTGAMAGCSTRSRRVIPRTLLSETVRNRVKNLRTLRGPSNSLSKDLPTTEEEAVKMFQLYGILLNEKICSNGHKMNLYFNKKNKIWGCRKRCCLEQVPLRKNSWFETSKMSFLTAIKFIYGWAHEMTSMKWGNLELNLSSHTIVDWNNYMREVCAYSLISREKCKIGGVDKIVEIDETIFNRRKNNTGRILPQQRLFGGLCKETKESFIIKIPNHSVETLLQAIVDNIEEGSIIISYCWQSYKSKELSEAGFEQFKLKHKYNFANPSSHTQTMKRFWGAARWRSKKQRGTAYHLFDSYLCEFMWRNLHHEDIFVDILNAISKFMPAK